MSELIHIPESPEADSTGNVKRHLIAAALSTIIPGAGQLFLGQRRKAIILLVVLVVLVIGFWPLRLPRSFPGTILLLWVCMLLLAYAVYDAFFDRNQGARLSKWWLLLCIPLIYVGFNILFTSLLLGSGFRALKFSSAAMEPTLFPNDKFIYDPNYYHGRPEQRGDLVVMRIEGAITVKRIAAVGGDTIEAKDRQVSVDGQVQDETFVQHTRPLGNNPQLDTFGPVVVPPGKYFVMGDNRDISRDSRLSDFGLVDAQSIIGTPLYIYRLPWEGKRWRKLQ